MCLLACWPCKSGTEGGRTFGKLLACWPCKSGTEGVRTLGNALPPKFAFLLSSLPITPEILYCGITKITKMSARSYLHGILSMFVTVHPHETSALLHSSSCFFFVSSHSPSSTLTLQFLSFSPSYPIGFSLWSADFECLLCGSSATRWRGNFFGVIEAPGAFRGISGAHFGGSACFHANFLVAQSLESKGIISIQLWL